MTKSVYDLLRYPLLESDQLSHTTSSTIRSKLIESRHHENKDDLHYNLKYDDYNIEQLSGFHIHKD